VERFEPYFLNTYLTHTTAANTSIVDGQQRLTTLLLILIKLYRILKSVEEDPANKGKTFNSKVVEQLIFETNDFGEAERFKSFNETRRRLSKNFEAISNYPDRFLRSGPAGAYDLIKATYYITYLLDRIVEIRIERQDNVAMIFEVVNARGLGLKPYEILKGTLFGGLPATQKEKANQVWTELQDQYFATELRNTTERTIDLDLFFRILRADREWPQLKARLEAE